MYKTTQCRPQVLGVFSSNANSMQRQSPRHLDRFPTCFRGRFTQHRTGTKLKNYNKPIQFRIQGLGLRVQGSGFRA